MKPASPLHGNADQNDHRLALLYASDYHISGIIFYKYPKYFGNFYTSLDHSIHFHSNDIDFNGWHLSDMECVYYGDELTLNKSRYIFSDFCMSSFVFIYIFITEFTAVMVF